MSNPYPLNMDPVRPNFSVIGASHAAVLSSPIMLIERASPA